MKAVILMELKCSLMAELHKFNWDIYLVYKSSTLAAKNRKINSDVTRETAIHYRSLFQ